MDFQFCCKVTYETGQENDYNTGGLTIQVEKDIYQKLMLGIHAGKQISDIEGVEDILPEMEEYISFVDRFYNMDGSRRSTPLKKNRAIKSYDFYVSERERKRIQKMKNPEAVFSREKQQMKIYRSDDSFVELSVENGFVTITDSKRQNQAVKMDADQFIRDIVRW